MRISPAKPGRLQAQRVHFGRPLVSISAVDGTSIPSNKLLCDVVSDLQNMSIFELARDALDQASTAAVGFASRDVIDTRFVYSGLRDSISVPMEDVTAEDGDEYLYAICVQKETEAWEKLRRKSNRHVLGRVSHRLVCKVVGDAVSIRYISQDAPYDRQGFCKVDKIDSDLRLSRSKLLLASGAFDDGTKGITPGSPHGYVALFHPNCKVVKHAASVVRQALNALPEDIDISTGVITTVGEEGEEGESVPVTVADVTIVSSAIISIAGDLSDFVPNDARLPRKVRAVTMFYASNVTASAVVWFLQQDVVLVAALIDLATVDDVVKEMAEKNYGWRALSRLAWLSLDELKKTGWRRKLGATMKQGTSEDWGSFAAKVLSGASLYHI